MTVVNATLCGGAAELYIISVYLYAICIGFCVYTFLAHWFKNVPNFWLIVLEMFQTRSKAIFSNFLKHLKTFRRQICCYKGDVLLFCGLSSHILHTSRSNRMLMLALESK